MLSEIKRRIQEEEYHIPYHYQDLFAPAQSIERNSIFKMIVDIFTEKIRGEKRIIDIGCGDGRFCYYAKKFLQIEGIDISKRAIHWAKAFNPELKFYCEPIERFAERIKKKYTGAVCIEVLEHICDDEISSFLKGIKKILKNEALIIFTVPSINKPMSVKHYRHYNQRLLFETLTPYFEVLEIKGHSKISSFHRKIFSVMHIVSLLFYSETFQWKFPNFVKFVKKIKENYWYNYLHEGRPEECYRLIAICRVCLV